MIVYFGEALASNSEASLGSKADGTLISVQFIRVSRYKINFPNNK